MHCERVEELLPLCLSGELAGGEGEEFSLHCAQCARCAALVKEQIRVDQLLRASMAGAPARARVVEDRVWEKIDAGSRWTGWLRPRMIRQAFAAAAILVAAYVGYGQWRRLQAAGLFESAAADHVEDVVSRIAKAGWVADERGAEDLAANVIGDRRPVRGFAPAGYKLARARTCNIEGKSQRWLHLIYTDGSREVSFFVRRQAPVRLGNDPKARSVDGLEVAGAREGALGVVVVGDVTEAESLRMLRAAGAAVS